MVIPVCYKCEQPIKIMSQLKDGLEVIGYQCTACNCTSASFLLGYVEQGSNAINKPKDIPETKARSELFAESSKNYSLRARMQTLVNFKKDDLLRIDPSEDTPE